MRYRILLLTFIAGIVVVVVVVVVFHRKQSNTLELAKLLEVCTLPALKKCCVQFFSSPSHSSPLILFLSSSSSFLFPFFPPPPPPSSLLPHSFLSHSSLCQHLKGHILTECPEDVCVRYFTAALQSLAGTEHTQVEQQLKKRPFCEIMQFLLLIVSLPLSFPPSCWSALPPRVYSSLPIVCKLGRSDFPHTWTPLPSSSTTFTPSPLSPPPSHLKN